MTEALLLRSSTKKLDSGRITQRPMLHKKINIEKNIREDFSVKTLAVDFIVNANNSYLDNTMLNHLQVEFDLDDEEALNDHFSHPEPGFYSLSNASDHKSLLPSELINAGLDRISKIVDNFNIKIQVFMG